jgi:hypothetical protein
MAREKARNRVPPVTRTNRTSAWDREFLGQNRYGAVEETPTRSFIPNRGSFGDSRALAEDSRRNSDLYILNAIQMAQQGADTTLLPYQPTPTINPGRPRTLAAGYDDRTQTLRIKFRDGDIYEYFQVPPSVWWKFQRAQSPGRFINITLNRYPYKRGLDS